MKGIKFFVAIFLCLVLSIGMTITSLAIDSGFSFETVSEEKANEFVSNVNISITYEEPPKKSIDKFAVNADGMIAISQAKMSSYKTICVYSDEGVFQYAFSFHSSGDVAVEWDEENLNIYFVRSDKIVSIAPNGEVVGVVEILDTKENNSYRNHILGANEYVIGDKEYSIKSDIGVLSLVSFSYSQLIVKDSNGESKIIYDVNSAHLVKMIISTVAILSFITYVVVGLVKLFKENSRQMGATSTDVNFVEHNFTRKGRKKNILKNRKERRWEFEADDGKHEITLKMLGSSTKENMEIYLDKRRVDTVKYFGVSLVPSMEYNFRYGDERITMVLHGNKIDMVYRGMLLNSKIEYKPENKLSVIYRIFVVALAISAASVIYLFNLIAGSSSGNLAYILSIATIVSSARLAYTASTTPFRPKKKKILMSLLYGVWAWVITFLVMLVFGNSTLW